MPNCANFISLRPKEVKLLSMDQHQKIDWILAEILEGMIPQPFRCWQRDLADGPRVGPFIHVT